MNFLLIVVLALCGFVAATPLPEEDKPRIVNGKPATSGKEYLVSIRLGKTNVHYYNHFCGGCIIGNKYILTAAHCFFGKTHANDMYTVSVGSLEWEKGTTYEVESVKYHENYDSKAIDNDIALIKLKTPIDFTKGSAKKISLPKQDEALPYHKKAVVAGWGVTKWEDEYIPPRALETTLEVLEQTDKSCAPYRINNNKFCAGNNGAAVSSTCQGDSGGPVAYDGKVIGIVSYASECNLANLSGVYAKVSTYTNWIGTTMQKMGN